MNVKAATIAVFTVILVCISTICAEEIEILADSAKVRLGGEVIATVEQGERFQMVKRKGHWVAIAVDTPQGPREGWVLVSQVRTLLPPGVDENAPAPGPPVLFELGAKLTQISGSSPTRASLFLEFSISNEDMMPVAFDTADFALEVDEQVIKPTAKAAAGRFGYQSVYAEPSMRSSTSSSSLPYLETGQIAPGETAVGWLRFELPSFRKARQLVAREWIISGKLGDKEVKLDLKATEIEAMALKVRPSAVEDSVQVIEIGERLNALNIGRLIDLLEPILIADKSCLIVPQRKECLADSLVRQEIQTAMQGLQASVVFAGLESQLRSRFGVYSSSRSSSGLSYATSEGTGAMQILGTRPSSGPTLAKHLANTDPTIRASAAQALATHTTEPGVLDALLKAAKDERPEVRRAAISSLGKADDSKAIAAVVTATSDQDAGVRSSAATAASNCPVDEVGQQLVKLLDDPQSNVVVAACTSVGHLRVKDAVSRLQLLRTGKDSNSRFAAIDALKAMRLISDVDAALGKLNTGRTSRSDFDILAKSDDERIVPSLVEGMKFQGYGSYNINEMARVLGEKGDRAAVEPLIAALEHGNIPSSAVAKALGELGDRRAIKPLQSLLERPAGSSSTRTAILEALMAIDSPNAVKLFASRLKRSKSSYEIGQMINLLGKGKDKESIALLEPYLDDRTHNRAAATALVSIGTKDALAPLRERLLTKDYAYGPSILSQLYQARTPEVLAIVRDASTSDNVAVRNLALNYANMAGPSDASRYLNDLRTSVGAQRWFEAGEAFQAAVRDRLTSIETSPDLARGFASFVTRLASAYRTSQEPDMADEQFARTLVAAMASMRAGATEDLGPELSRLRNDRIIWALDSGEIQKAQNMMRAELDDSRTALEQSPETVTNVLRLFHALDTELQLLARTARDELAVKRNDYFEILFEQTRRHASDERITAAFVAGQSRELQAWVQSDPHGAERHVQKLRGFIDSLKNVDPAIGARLAAADRSFQSLSDDISRWKEYAAVTARGIESLEKLGGRTFGSGAKVSWSPDAKRVVCGKAPMGMGLQIIDRQTGAVSELVDSGKDPAWSPDGRYIAYVTSKSANPYVSEEVWLIRLGQEEPRRLADGGFPSWSQDGKTLFVHTLRNRNILAIDVDDPDAAPRVFFKNAPSHYFTVSPDEKRIAVSTSNELLVFGRISGAIIQRWPLPGNRGVLPAWSPDGRWIAFGGFNNELLGLWALDVNESQTIRLASGPFTMPAWSRDGKTLAFDRRSPGHNQVWMMKTDMLESLPAHSAESVIATLSREKAAVEAKRSTRPLRHVDLSNLTSDTPQPEGWALAFDGRSDLVTGPHIPFDQYETFTVEAWVRGWSSAILCQGQAGDPENSVWLSLGANAGEPHETCGWEEGDGKNHQAAVGGGDVAGWNHVALVYDGERQSVFLNGQLVHSAPAPKPGALDRSRGLAIGAHQYESMRYGSGLLGSVRISDVVRYDEPFAPDWKFVTDANTVLLYDFASGEGQQLRDASGNDNHGSIVRPQWLAANQVYSLNLHATDISDTQLAQLKGLTALHRLNLSQTNIGDAGLEHLRKLTNLNELLLGETQVAGPGLKHLRGLTQLTNLGLFGTQVTDADLEHLQTLTRLQRLRLIQTQVGDAGLAHLQGLRELKELWLGKTRVTDAGLEHLKTLTQLERLGLKETRVTDAGLESIRGLTKLRELNLSGTQVTNLGLMQIQELTNLETLYLWQTRVTSNGLAHLKGLNKLKLLSLGHTRTSDTGLLHLHGLKNLETLYVTEAPVSTTGIAKLKQAVLSVQIQGAPTR